jgi:lysophospholipase L1-like esterase
MLTNRNLWVFFGGFSTAITLTTLIMLGRQTWDKGNLISGVDSRLRRRKVLFFGDSITQHGLNTDIHGWIAKLGNWWTRRVDVLNRGFSGYNTRWARQVVQEVVVDERPDLVFVFFGANDAVDESVLQHVPLEEYRSNLQYIARTLREVRSCKACNRNRHHIWTD